MIGNHICAPGQYEASLRICLHKELNWGFMGEHVNPSPTTLSVKLQIDQEEPILVASGSVDGTTWPKIQKRQLDALNLQHVRLLFDPLSFWFTLSLDHFEVRQACQVIFEFSDVQNPWWKKGMEWDFIQLKRLD